jgi:hypothetical protein
MEYIRELWAGLLVRRVSEREMGWLHKSFEPIFF